LNFLLITVSNTANKERTGGHKNGEEKNISKFTGRDPAFFLYSNTSLCRECSEAEAGQ
jgi:hypothetical protein